MVVFSLMSGLRYLHWTVLMVILAAVPVFMALFATYWFLYTGLLWLLYGFAFIAYVNQLMACRVFKKLSRYTDFLLPPPEDIPVEAMSGL